MLPFRSIDDVFDVNASCGRAIALQAQGETAAAAALWRRIVVTIPDNAEVQFNLGATLLPLGEFQDAEAALRRAIALKPTWASPRHRLGNLLYATGRWDEAEPHYLEALRLAPDIWRCAFDLANLRLGQGDFAGGWPFFEQRRNLGDNHLRPPPLPNEWLGEPLAGKSALVWPEQGFGDQIQFARFVPELAARGADVTLLAPPELVRLFEASVASANVRVVAKVDGVEIEQPDHWALIGSLPGRLDVTLASLSGAPYLSVPQAARNRWKGFAPQGGVGVVWQGRATPNPHRSLPSADLLEPLARAGANLIDISPPPGGDFADVAAMIEQLDLVVTIDTAAAHLAGALGKPCWVMLPWLNADWRWMQGRTDSPWYDSVRLFRQPAHGDWNSVIEEVAAAWTAGFAASAPRTSRPSPQILAR